MPALRLAAACLLAAFPFHTEATAAARPAGLAMVEEMNSVRSAKGLEPLRYSPSLARSSKSFSRRLLRQDRFRHGARIMASDRFSKLGEILALLRGRDATLGGSTNVSRALATWLESPGHRAVMLSRKYRYAGAGWAGGRMGTRRAVVWTAQFGV